jgi:nitrite reductase/ring-hydroxylating ferredoxin subunit
MRYIPPITCLNTTMKEYSIIGLAILLTLSGCLGSGSDTAPSAATAGASSGSLIAKVSDMPPGTSINFDYNGQSAVLANFDGTYVAYTNSCTHKGGQLKAQDDKLVCQMHKAEFDKNGQNTKGPMAAPETKLDPLSPIAVEVKGDGIYLK